MVFLASILFCDFENKSCNWKTDEQDRIGWQKQHGEPEFTNSGPSTDHTSTSGKHMTVIINCVSIHLKNNFSLFFSITNNPSSI